MTNPADPVVDLTENFCASCNQVADGNEMIGCDGCHRWFHNRCVGAMANVMNEEKWYCDEDACQVRAQESMSKKKKNRGKKNDDDSGRSSVKSDRALTLEHKIKAMEEKRKQMEYELEMEVKLKKKELEFKRAMEIKRMLLEKEMRDQEEEEEKLLQEKILQQRKEQFNRMKVKQKSFQREMENLDEQMINLKISGEKQKKNAMKDVDTGEGIPNRTPLQNSKGGNLTVQKLKKMKKAAQVNDDDDDEDNESDGEDNSGRSEDEETDNFSKRSGDTKGKKSKCKEKVDEKSPDGLGRPRSRPTKVQLAARNGLSKKLPTFSGKPEEWPLFYGAYQASNEACGYSDIENLVRLQECLKGPALEMVRGQLLLPKSVPKAIQKLRQLYGRPEQLLRSHLEKVRRLEPPLAGNLASFIPFGTAVEQLCEHLEAADLKQHLINPLLIQDLVDKLPDMDKRDWVRYKRGKKRVTLRTLTDFLSEIVSDACEANVNVEFKPTSEFSSDQSNASETECNYSEDEDQQSGVEERRTTPCRVCQCTDHRLRNCQDFKNLSYADRMEIVDRWDVCHMCLNEHGSTQCKFKRRCNVGVCRQAHNSVLHPTDGVVGTSAHIRTNNTVMFRMIPVKLHCGEKSITVLAFLDEGASVTLVEKSLADRLGAVGVHEKLTIKWTADITRVEKDSTRMNIWVSDVGVNEKLLLKTVHTVDKLMLPAQSLDAKQLALQYNHMRGLPISSYNGRPEILIGLNNINSFAPIEAKIGKVADPIAVRCKLGWTVYGPKQGNAAETESNWLGFHQEGDRENRHKLLKTLDESVMNVSSESAEDIGASKPLEKTTTRTDDRFEASTMWKPEDSWSSESSLLALRRSKKSESRLEMNPVCFQHVCGQKKGTIIGTKLDYTRALNTNLILTQTTREQISEEATKEVTSKDLLNHKRKRRTIHVHTIVLKSSEKMENVVQNLKKELKSIDDGCGSWIPKISSLQPRANRNGGILKRIIRSVKFQFSENSTI